MATENILYKLGLIVSNAHHNEFPHTSSILENSINDPSCQYHAAMWYGFIIGEIWFILSESLRCTAPKLISSLTNLHLFDSNWNGIYYSSHVLFHICSKK